MPADLPSDDDLLEAVFGENDGQVECEACDGTGTVEHHGRRVGCVACSGWGWRDP